MVGVAHQLAGPWLYWILYEQMLYHLCIVCFFWEPGLWCDIEYSIIVREEGKVSFSSRLYCVSLP